MHLEKMIRKAAKELEFSGVVFLAKNGKTIFHEAFGLADRSNKIEKYHSHSIWMCFWDKVSNCSRSWTIN